MGPTRAALILGALLSGCGVETPKDGPEADIELISMRCEMAAGRPHAFVVARSHEKSELRMARAFVSFGGHVSRAYLTPRPLPPGAVGKATVVGPAYLKTADCTLFALQDRYGPSWHLHDP